MVGDNDGMVSSECAGKSAKVLRLSSCVEPSGVSVRSQTFCEKSVLLAAAVKHLEHPLLPA